MQSVSGWPDMRERHALKRLNAEYFHDIRKPEGPPLLP